MLLNHKNEVIIFENSDELDSLSKNNDTISQFINSTSSNLTIDMKSITEMKSAELLFIISLRLKTQNRKLVLINMNNKIEEKIKNFNLDVVLN